MKETILTQEAIVHFEIRLFEENNLTRNSFLQLVQAKLD
jgi:hypothetical protein